MGLLPFRMPTLPGPVDIWSNQPGLSHPFGGRWDTSWKDQTYRFTFQHGSPASSDFESSTALQQIVEATITNHKAALIAAYDGSVEWPVSQYLDFHDSKDLLSTETVVIGFNNLGYAFGKVDIVGKLRVSYKKTGTNSITVGSIEATGSFDDLYDFAYGSGGKAREAAMVEAGHATLATSPEANSGKVFFTRLEFNTGFKSWNRNY